VANDGSWLDAAGNGIHILSAIGAVALLVALTLINWRAYRLDAPGQDRLRVARRLLVPAWAFVALLAVTGLFGEARNGLLLLGEQVLIAQAVFALAFLTWRLVGGGLERGGQPAERLGSAIVSAIGLLATLLALVTAVALG
jgi:heme A synthase